LSSQTQRLDIALVSKKKLLIDPEEGLKTTKRTPMENREPESSATDPSKPLLLAVRHMDFSDRDAYLAVRSINKPLRDAADRKVLREVTQMPTSDLRRNRDWRLQLLRVNKRDGRSELASVGKIITRLERLAMPDLRVDCEDLARRVMDSLTHGMSTSRLDEIAAREAHSRGLREPDYLLLAARIAVSNLHKETSPRVGDVVRAMLAGDTSRRRPSPLIDRDCADFMLFYEPQLQSLLDFDRDYKFSYFGIKTLLRSLTTIHGKVVERPQHLFLREAVGINRSRIADWNVMTTRYPGRKSEELAEEILASIRETYQATSNFLYTHASPTKFNAATPLGQLASCFLLTPADDGDSIEGIFELVKRCAKISQSAGGIGFSMTSVRGASAYIHGTNGLSRGIMPFVRVFNETARAVDQGGAKRPGAFACYLEPWHLDVEAFLRMKRIQKKEGDKKASGEEVRCFEMFQALWIPDLFFKRVVSNGAWCLFTPDETKELVDTWGDEFEKHYLASEARARAWTDLHAEEVESGVAPSKQTLPPLTFKFVEGGARSLLETISHTILETGGPYLLSKDAANRKSNQQNLGTIKSSNLCVAGHTRILTDRGQLPIESLVDQQVNVWNGEEWSQVTVRQTGSGKDLLKITFSNGTELECTPYHKFLLHGKDGPVEAQELKIGDKLVRLELPPAFELKPNTPFPHPYTHGFFCGDGTYRNGKPDVTVYSEKKRCAIPYLALRKAEPKKWSPAGSDEVHIICRLSCDLPQKFAVPLDQTVETRLRWLEGLLDADGSVCPSGKSSQSLQLGSIHRDFLVNVRLLLQTLGVESVVSLGNPSGSVNIPGQKPSFHRDCDRLQIATHGVQVLQSLGFAPKRLSLIITETSPSRPTRYPKVLKIEKGARNADTFCFTEPKRGMGVFEGVLTLQCSEVIEYSSPDETAVCNLASIGLPSFVVDAYTDNARFDYEKLHAVARLVTRNLNLVVDSTTYPIESARRSNLKHRPIGIGVQGLADVFYMMRLPYLSTEAREINKRVFETIYHGAMTESIELARVHGTYESYEGSPLSKGQLQFDLWGEPEPDGLWDWKPVRESLAQHGARNSLLLAPMPTASTSSIMGNVESFEPGHNVYLRRVEETFPVVNKHLARELRAMKLWYPEILSDILAANGSIQHIPEIPARYKEIYRTVWELKLIPQIDMARDRGLYVCQSQSFNWHMSDPTPEMIQKAAIHAWKQGLKTLMYYCRIQPKTNAVQITNLRLQRQATLVGSSDSTKSAETLEPEGEVCEMKEGCVMCHG
jgi:ribonucleoside-diphosphate reductase alpha chain